MRTEKLNATQTSALAACFCAVILIFISGTNSFAGDHVDDNLWHASDAKMCSHISTFGAEFAKASQQPSTALALEYLKKSYAGLIRGPSVAFINEYDSRIKSGLICDDSGNVVQYTNYNSADDMFR
jgi:hypothetical protein